MERDSSSVTQDKVTVVFMHGLDPRVLARRRGHGTIEEQATAILFLALNEASYISGVTLPVAGGDLS